MVPNIIHDTTHCYNVEKFYKKLPESKKPLQEAAPTETPKKQNGQSLHMDFSTMIYIAVGVVCCSVTLTLICIIECQRISRKEY